MFSNTRPFNINDRVHGTAERGLWLHQSSSIPQMHPLAWEPIQYTVPCTGLIVIYRGLAWPRPAASGPQHAHLCQRQREREREREEACFICISVNDRGHKNWQQYRFRNFFAHSKFTIIGEINPGMNMNFFALQFLCKKVCVNASYFVFCTCSPSPVVCIIV